MQLEYLYCCCILITYIRRDPLLRKTGRFFTLRVGNFSNSIYSIYLSLTYVRVLAFLLFSINFRIPHKTHQSNKCALLVIGLFFLFLLHSVFYFRAILYSLPTLLHGIAFLDFLNVL